MIFSVISSVLIIISIVCLFGLTPERVTDDLMRLITPNDTMRDKSRNLRGNKKKHRLYRTLVKMKTALAVTGKSKQFTIVCCASLILFAAGIIVSVLIDNIFLMPVLSVAFALIPFFYTTSSLSYYEKNTKEELETAMSIITTSYVRSDDIVAAVRENIKYIKPPLRDVFKSFEGEATAISSNIKRALYKLKSMVDNEIFWEWCDTLIQCQDDRTLKDTLLPIVAKLTDVRIVNSELKTMLSSARNEYWFMVALVVGNIPLLYLLNKDWFHTLLFTTPGKLVCGIAMIPFELVYSNSILPRFLRYGYSFLLLHLHFTICDRKKRFKKGRLSCYINTAGDNRPKYRVSDKNIDGYKHLGRLVLTLRNYEVFEDDDNEAFFFLDGKTVLVEKDLNFDSKLKGRKNFTLMHEGSHQIFKMLFPNDYGVTQKSAGVHYYKANSERNKPISDWEEWQANTLGAAILLPENLIKQGMYLFSLGEKIECLNKIYYPSVYKRFDALADFLGCSKKALAIRMKQLGLLKKEYLDNVAETTHYFLREATQYESACG